MNAILGGVMAGWATLMYFVTASPVAEGDVKLTRQMLIAIIAWFCVDSTGSSLSQLPGKILLNLIFLVLLAMPLLVLSNEIFPVKQTAEQE